MSRVLISTSSMDDPLQIFITMTPLTSFGKSSNNVFNFSDNVSTYNTLVLAKDAGDTVSTIKFVVGKVYTMPDGQPGLKLQRIA